MKIIIFAGGTGKRFWPASTKDNPKQFQSIVDNKPLVQVKYDYLRQGFKPEDIFLSTGKGYKNEVKQILSELPEENFIFEPAMRDNGPAVAYAVKKIYDRFGNVPISIQWADHYIKDPLLFNKVLKAGEKVVKKENKSVFVGVPIRYANPNRGHIKFGKVLKSIDGEGYIKLAEFSRFVEKPSLEVANQYINSGDYAWNPGYCITKPEILFEKYKKFAPQILKVIDSNDNEYSKLEKVGFDFIFSENLEQNEAYVLISDFGWSDIGEWVSLKEALEDNQSDNVTKGLVKLIESQDCLVYNYEDNKLVAGVNLSDFVIVNTKSAVAVFPKSKNNNIKKLLANLEKNKELKHYL